MLTKVLKLFLLLLIIGAVSCNSESKPTNDDSAEKKLFTLLDNDSTGIHFINQVIERPDRSYYVFNPIYNGGGVALGDINNDGLLDIYFTGNDVPNKLYLNLGDMKFKDISKESGIDESRGWHNGATMVDINSDGYLDIYVCKGGYEPDSILRKNLLYLNNGDLSFTESAERFGIADPGFSYHACFFDYDQDNDLDLFVINHPTQSFLNIPAYKMGEQGGSWLSKDHLYRNDNGYYTDVTKEAGLANNYGFGLSVICSDINEDGLADIFVANDYKQKDYLWLNNGDGSFTESVESTFRHISLFSMGSDLADINNDGKEDLFVAEMLPEDYKRSKTTMANMSTSNFNSMVRNGMHYQYMHNVLQLNRGQGQFSEIAQMAEISKTDWSWSSFLSDFDQDGYRDLFVSNGYRRDVYDRDSEEDRRAYFEKTGGKIENTEEFYKLIPATKLVNSFFRNNGDFTFEKKSTEWAADIGSFSNGASVGDLDNDGDLDIVVNNLEDKAFVYRNNISGQSSKRSIQIKLVGPKNNAAGIGAQLTVSTPTMTQSFIQKTNRGFLASSDPVVHFGVGSEEFVDIEVVWPDRKLSRLKNIATNTKVDVLYSEAKEYAQNDDPASTLFVDKTQEYLGAIRHTENEFNDFHSQILLPHKLSRLGPCVSVGDVNGDGRDDFYIGGAKSQAGRIFTQQSNGNFIENPQSQFITDREFEDVGSYFFDHDQDGDLDLYVVSGGTEWPANSDMYQDRLYLNNGNGAFSISSGIVPKITSSGSCIVASDFDKDGDLDLFIGGRTVPDMYPQPPKSTLLENINGIYKDVTSVKAGGLEKIGMVSSAVWTDFNGDKMVDLILVGEWMPVSIFQNTNGSFENVSADYGLEKTSGWWNRIVEYDVDRDGDMDYFLGNLGQNYKFHASQEKPFSIYSSDFDQNGSYDILLAKYYDGIQVPVRGRQCASEQMPFIEKKFPSYEAFAEASLNQIVDLQQKDVLKKEAYEFHSMIMMNNGQDGFELNPLPELAQISTINSFAVVPQKNSKGFQLLIGGNMFDSEVETTRADASIGLLLNSVDGKTYEYLDSKLSGVNLPYNIKEIKSITINDSDCFLIASNDDILRCICRDF